MITYKNRLPVAVGVGYISAAPHKTGAGIRTPLTIRAHNRASGFFTCKASSRLFRIMVGRTGEPQGSPGSLVAGSSNPVRLATRDSFRFKFSQKTHSHLNSALLWGYIACAVTMLTAGFDSPNHKADDRCFCMRFFYIRSKPSYAQIMVRRGRGAIVRAGFFVAGLSTLLRLTTSFDSGLVRLNKTHKEAIFLCPAANQTAPKCAVSILRPKSTAVSTAPAHWQHTSRFVLIICRQICRSTGSRRSWTTLQTICWNCSSLLTLRNDQTKKTHYLKYCLRSACWWGAHGYVIQGAV